MPDWRTYLTALSLVLLASTLAASAPNPNHETDTEKMAAFYKAYREKKAKEFKGQRFKDRLELVTDNSFLDHEMVPVPEGPVLLVVKVRPWEEQNPLGAGFGKSDWGNTIIFRSADGSESLFATQHLTRTSLIEVQKFASLEVPAQSRGFAAVWALAPKNGEKRRVIVQFGTDSFRAEYQSNSRLNILLTSAGDSQRLSTRVESVLEERASAILSDGNSKSEGIIQVLDKSGKVRRSSRIRKVSGSSNEQILIEDTTSGAPDALSTAAASTSRMPFVSAEHRARLVRAQNWIVSHGTRSGHIGIVRIGAAGFASTEIWDSSKGGLGALEETFLYSSTGLVTPRRSSFQVSDADKQRSIETGEWDIEKNAFVPIGRLVRTRDVNRRDSVDKKGAGTP